MNKNLQIRRVDYEAKDLIDRILEISSQSKPCNVDIKFVQQTVKKNRGGICLICNDNTVEMPGPKQIVGFVLATMSKSPPLTTIRHIWVADRSEKAEIESALLETVFEISSGRGYKILDVHAEYHPQTAKCFEDNEFYLHDDIYRLSLREQ